MKAKVRAKARQPTPGRMNKTEKRYADDVLTPLQLAGEIVGYWFESHKLRLADKTWYTPDFMVQLQSGELEFHEVKGFWRDDARVKIKVAAAQFPFRFFAVRLIKSRWHTEEISGN